MRNNIYSHLILTLVSCLTVLASCAVDSQQGSPGCVAPDDCDPWETCRAGRCVLTEGEDPSDAGQDTPTTDAPDLDSSLETPDVPEDSDTSLDATTDAPTDAPDSDASLETPDVPEDSDTSLDASVDALDTTDEEDVPLCDDNGCGGCLDASSEGLTPGGICGTCGVARCVDEDLVCDEPAEAIFVTTTEDLVEVDGLCSLREAVNAVNAGIPNPDCGAASGELVVLVSGQYLLSADGDMGEEDENVSGDLDIKRSITIDRCGLDDVEIVGSGDGRLFEMEEVDTTLILGEIDLRGGRLVNGRANSVFRGGAILARGRLELKGTRVSDNMVAGWPGESAPSIDSVGGGGGGGGGRIEGGAIYVLATALVTLDDGPTRRCLFEENIVVGGAGGDGAQSGLFFGRGGDGGGPASCHGVGGIGNRPPTDGSMGCGGGGGGVHQRGGDGGTLGGGGGGGGTQDGLQDGSAGGQYAGGGGASGDSFSPGGGGGGAGLGGAIYVAGRLEVTSCIFRGNRAVGGEGGQGAMPGEPGLGVGGAIFVGPDGSVSGTIDYEANSADVSPDMGQ